MSVCQARWDLGFQGCGFKDLGFWGQRSSHGENAGLGLRHQKRTSRCAIGCQHVHDDDDDDDDGVDYDDEDDNNNDICKDNGNEADTDI